MEILLAVLAFLLATVLLVRVAVRAARRRIRGLTDRARLTARAYGVGPAAEVARLRREMERSLGGARRALAAARAVHSPVGDVPSLLARLELAARAVDGELRVLEAQSEIRCCPACRAALARGGDQLLGHLLGRRPAAGVRL